jgi:hypothetical protein
MLCLEDEGQRLLQSVRTLSTSVHGVASQKIKLVVVTAVISSNSLPLFNASYCQEYVVLNQAWICHSELMHFALNRSPFHIVPLFVVYMPWQLHNAEPTVCFSSFTCPFRFPHVTLSVDLVLPPALSICSDILIHPVISCTASENIKHGHHIGFSRWLFTTVCMTPECGLWCVYVHSSHLSEAPNSQISVSHGGKY